jgi:hypothetical protein
VPPSGVWVLPTSIAARELFVRGLKKAHDGLIEKMNKFGVFDAKSEGTYPENWMRPTEISKTHPIFYVNGKGDIIFLKSTRKEYFRYKYQQKLGRSYRSWKKME